MAALNFARWAGVGVERRSRRPIVKFGCVDTLQADRYPTLLVDGQDYVLYRDNQTESDASHRGILVRIGGSVWPLPAARTEGLLTLSKTSPHGNIKVTYVAGYSRLLANVVLAANQLVAQLRRYAVDGGPVAQESYDFYRYERIAADLEQSVMGTVANLLRRYKRWVW